MPPSNRRPLSSFSWSEIYDMIHHHTYSDLVLLGSSKVSKIQNGDKLCAIYPRTSPSATSINNSIIVYLELQQLSSSSQQLQQELRQSAKELNEYHNEKIVQTNARLLQEFESKKAKLPPKSKKGDKSNENSDDNR